MQLLCATQARELREIFIGTFIDTTGDFYISRIQKRILCSDGLCYTGYLWDVLLHRRQVSAPYVIHRLTENQSPVYAFWDIHSRDQILIPNYWKYLKDAVLQLAPTEIEGILPTLPEDCYFFDASLSWAAALTHEESKPGKRICFFCGS